MISIRAAAESHTGYVRTNNEDLAVVSGDLAAIADGMGGHLGGEVAARTAIEELVEAFQRDRTAAGLAAAVRRANRAIWRKSRVDRKLHGMGTTLTAAALVAGGDGKDGAETHLALVNIGDSRAYRLERGDDSRPSLSRLTEDHSVVEEMVRQGELTPAEAAVHPHRHVLTRALGIDSEVDLDIWDLEPLPGTRILLCSDGLTDEVPEEEIAGVLAGADDPHDAARELIGRALAHGGMDNVTVVVVDVVEGATGEPQGLEMVPPRPPMPDLGEDRFGTDVTQAVPIMKPGDPPAGAAGVPAGSASEGDAGPAPTVGSAPVDTPTEQAHTDQAGVAPAAAPPYDAELDEGEPTVASTPGAGPGADAAAEAGALVAGAGLAAGAGTAAAAVSGAGTDTTESVPAASEWAPESETPRRGGRSMTVRAAAPAAIGSSAATDGSSAPTRGTVLIPTRRLSKQYRDRIVTFRVFLFLLVLAALMGGVVAVVIWFQRSSFYVGLTGQRISIYQGRPGGLMWFKPTLLETSDITTKDLLPNSVTEVRRGIAESSYAAAKQEVTDLSRLSAALGMNPNQSTTTSTTGLTTASTAPPFTTTTPTSAPAATTTPTTQPPITTTTAPKATTTTKVSLP